MEILYKDFIGVYKNVYADGFCSHVISEFERICDKGYCGNRQDSENIGKRMKDDNFYFLNLKNHVLSSYNGLDPTKVFFEGLQACYDSYIQEYDVLQDVDMKCTSIKLQRTKPGGGYHVWHAEQGNSESANRILTYILYLNSLEDDAAGETEFLYQKVRIPPQENTMVIWPAAYTHAHRGNVVHGNDSKYIITGWFYLE
jgi:hypothetical protein